MSSNTLEIIQGLAPLSFTEARFVSTINQILS